MPTENSFSPDILLLNGPNLSRLGRSRDPLYGLDTLIDIEGRCLKIANQAGKKIKMCQSNSEGSLIDIIEQHFNVKSIVINPGALMIHGYSLRDALDEFPGFKVEIHISHIYARENFRRCSILAPVMDAMITGLGSRGYDAAVNAVIDHLK